MGKLIDLPKAKKPCKVNYLNKEKSHAEIIIYDDIGKDGFWFEAFGAKQLDEELKKLDKSVKKIDVRLNSPGGSVFEGHTIYNRLKQHSAEIIVYIDGIAASIASVIAMAGDEIIMGEGSQIMIHKPWSFVQGDATQMEKEAEILDRLEDQIINIYKKKTGLTDMELRKMVAEETWISGEEAVDMGFATKLAEDGELQKAAASVDKPWINKKPKVEDVQAHAQVKIAEFAQEMKDFLARK